jgi:type I restriction enzyme M protein
MRKNISSQREKHLNNKEKVFGQFFTPYEIAEFIVDFALRHVENPRRGIDPACGDGVFLKAMLIKGLEEVWGIDIDPEVTKYIPQNVKEKSKILIGDALARNSLFDPKIPENYFDIAVGNPPFSAKYGRITDYRLKMYEVSKDRKSEAIENLFIERFIRLVRPGGVVGVIIPDGVLLSKLNEHIRRFILKYKVIAVVSLPRGIFRSTTGTTSKTSILFIKKEPNNGEKAFFYEVKEDIKEVYEAYEKRMGCWKTPSIEILHPKLCQIADLEISTYYPVKPLKELIVDMRSGRTEYGEKRKFVEKGIRYISAKVIMPYGLDFSRDKKYVEPNSPMDKKSAYVKPGDVLFVRVGVGCIGRAAVAIDEEDTGIADDWIYIIRVDERQILPHYLAIYFYTQLAKKQIENLNRGVGTVTIPQSELKKLLVIIPPLEFQEEVRRQYIEMVKKQRSGEKKKAMEMFNELKGKVENAIHMHQYVFE